MSAKNPTIMMTAGYQMEMTRSGTLVVEPMNWLDVTPGYATLPDQDIFKFLCDCIPVCRPGAKLVLPKKKGKRT